MTELETLERARMYMEKLANGINPIDDSVVPDGDVINNVRLSRCFFYVAEVLRQTIANGGVKPQKKVRNVPFLLPIDTRAQFAYSETPIPISEIAKRINSLTPEKMKPLSYRAIRDWLSSLGMLEDIQTAEGKTTKHPTQRGERMGILLESRTGRDGPYFVVLYSAAAQHFILDNLDAVVEFDRTQKANRNEPRRMGQTDNC